MKNLPTSENVYVSESKIRNAGRGVFAKRNIKKGETVERCPTIEIPKNDVANLYGSLLITYFFYYGKNMNRSSMALGFGSMYNHSYKPNVKFRIKPSEKLIEFVALKYIRKNEEITFNYRGLGRSKKNPLWFEV